MAKLRKKAPGSLFRRVFTFMTITIIVCIVIASGSLILFLTDFWKNDRLTRLSDDALSLSRSVLSIYEGSYNTDIFAQNSELLSSTYLAVAEPAEAELIVFADDGSVVYCQEKANGASICPMHDAIRLDDAVMQETFVKYPLSFNTQTAVSFREEDVFLSSVAIVTGDKQLFYVVAFQDVSEAYLPYTTVFVRMFIRAALIGVFVAFVVSLITSYRLVSPLKKMTAVTKLYAQGDFSERISAEDTYNELAVFTESFNSMADSLERIEESRSAFVSNTSHELKTPMTIISGFIDGILDGTIPPEDEEKYLRIVSEETKRLSSLVVAMLNISKIEAGKLELSKTQVDLSHMICRVMLDFEQTIEKKKVAILGLDTLAPLKVTADETLLHQVIFNLADNAVKFTPENGQIKLTLKQDGNNAVFCIRNTGRGIPASDQELIFDRFYKVDKSRGLDSKSFGIGLYIVKSIIDLHGGTINVSSDGVTYTEFSVALPIVPPDTEN